MKKIAKKLVACFAVLITALSVASPMVTYAKVPYKTYTQNGYAEYVQTQTSYTPDHTIIKFIDKEGKDFRLSKPDDMKITDDGTLYIADTGNARIVISDLKGNVIDFVGEGTLVSPKGIFVTEDKTVYVADEAYYGNNNGAVLVFDNTGKKIAEYGKPNSPLYGKSAFIPQKITVDVGGNMYITSQGNTNGVIQLTPAEGGTFLGYFGTNDTEISLYQKVLDLILTEEQKSTSNSNLPQSVKNICIDDKGLIYTLTSGSATLTPLKKLNIAGSNLLTTEVPPYNSLAVAVGKYENIFVCSEDGYLYEYTKEGTLLFNFGGKDNSENRVGLFDAISAVDVDVNDNVYILDSGSNEIQVFVTTEFTDYVHESLVLYQKGLYSESMVPLNKIIMMNSLFDYANQAMGQALYQTEDYDQALDYYRLAKDKEGYSNAFWEIRNVWLKDNLVVSIAVIVLIIVLINIAKRLDKKYRIFDPVRKVTSKFTTKLLYRQLTYGKKYMVHPLDGAYDVKRKGMKSYIATPIIMLVIIIFNVINKYFGGFVVKTARDGRYDIVQDIGIVILGFVLSAAVIYLISSINDGESRFKELFCGLVYSFTPFIIIQPFIYLFGLVVTNNELFVIEFANFIMITWIVILIFMTIKEINNYTVWETIKVIFLSLFATLVFALIGFVMYVLISQVIGFITSIGGEVVYRIGK